MFADHVEDAYEHLEVAMSTAQGRTLHYADDLQWKFSLYGPSRPMWTSQKIIRKGEYFWWEIREIALFTEVHPQGHFAASIYLKGLDQSIVPPFRKHFEQVKADHDRGDF